MKIIVITGSTRGIGLAMADAFLAQGCAVVVSGRNQNSVDAAVGLLSQKYDQERLLGVPCQVSALQQVEALWAAAEKRFGRVDVWVNNAGAAHGVQKLWELPSDKMRTIIETNILGVLHGVRVAMQGMIAQDSGKIFNLEGYGSTKRIMAGLNVYGTTKAGITFLSKALALEAKDTPIIIGTLQPGMVMTDLILDQYKNQPEALEKVKPIFNIIADRPENVGPYLVEKMLAANRSGASIHYLSSWRMAWRFMTARFSKRDLFTE
jgi:NAD(P)-dependent dehydrogenase (short-subunit alcohol dehydrogenase family)